MNRAIPIILLLLAAPIAYVGLSLCLGMTWLEVLYAYLITTALTFAGLGIAHLYGETVWFRNNIVVVHLVTTAAGTAVFIHPVLAIIPAAATQLLVGVADSMAKAILKQELDF